MNYPLISEYIEAIKAAEENFEQLKHLRPVLDDDGQPVMSSGNFAVVFKMKNEQTGKLHAVKCFLKEQEGRAEAYRLIAEELEYVSSTFLTPIKYLDNELFVDTAQTTETEFPVLLMDWVEGQTLDKYIREHIDDQYELSLLAYQFSRLAMWLMPQPFAHGDLKPDNILVRNDGTLALVDYDGMYVPAMKGQKARELGSPDFRHPSRTEDVFDEHIDDFSLVSILLSLKAISLQPDLLEQYGASDRLLLSERDYRNLSESQALEALRPLMKDSEMVTLSSLFMISSAQNNLSLVSFRLFNLCRPKATEYENLSTKVTEEDLTNTTTDEYLYKKIQKCASEIMLSIEDVQKEELDKKLLYIELTMLSAASVLEMSNAKNDNWQNFIEQKIFNEYVSIKDIEDYDSWIESNTPGLYINDVYIISDGTSLEEFEKVNGPVRFFSGKINAYPYDERLWGEFVDKNGKKQIIYVDQGFPSDYSISDVLNDKQAFAVVEEKDTYYGSNDIVYCLKKIKKNHSMLPDYISERLSFYTKAVDDAMSNKDNKKAYAFQLYNAVTYERLNYNSPYLGIDLEFDYDTIVNCQTGEEYHYNATSLNNFTLCIEEELSSLRLELNVNNTEEYLSTEVTEEDLKNAWTDKYGVIYSSDGKRLLKAGYNDEIGGTKPIVYNIREGVEIICDGALHMSQYLEEVNMPNSVRLIGEGSFEYCYNLKSVKMSNNITSIGSKAFASCFDLQSIVIPKNVERIGLNPFAGSGITNIQCDSILYETDNNALYDKGKKELIAIFRNVVDLLLPKSVIKIGDYSCYECKNLETISLHDGIMSIGNYAFCDSSLNLINLPDTLSIIGEAAFAGTSIPTIYIPSCVEFIGDSAFANCDYCHSFLIERGGQQKFKGMLSGYKKIFVEVDYAERNEWITKTRPFSSDEIAAVESSFVTTIKKIQMVRFDFVNGGYTVLPLDERCSFSEGHVIDLNKAKLIMTFHNGSVDTYKVFIE